MNVAEADVRAAGSVQRQDTTEDEYGEGGYGLVPYGGTSGGGGGGGGGTPASANLALIVGLVGIAWVAFREQ